MINKCPITVPFLKAAGYNIQKLAKNKKKTVESVRAATLQAFSILLNIWNRRADVLQSYIAIALRRGGADKQKFRRLNSVGITVGYRKSLAVQEGLGIGFDDLVKGMNER